MRCPNCGAFLEQGKVICNMCGTNSTTFVPPNNNNNNFGSNDGMFSTGMNTGNGNYNDYNPALNNFKNTSTKKEYHNVELVPVKNGEKDIFDFFAENKKMLGFVGIVLLFALIAFIGWKYYEKKMEPPVEEPILLNLYFEVDDSFQKLEGNNNALIYSRTGSKGSECSITISYGSNTSSDHVKEYFAAVHKKLEPAKDTNGNIVNQLDVYVPTESQMELNSATWYYLNLFYKTNTTDASATHLRYKYLTAIYKGHFYDIELANNSNDNVCGASLDNFSKSLKFIDTKDAKE